MRAMVRDYVKIATDVATGVAGELRSKLPQPVRELADEVVGRALAESEKVWHRLSDGVVQAGVVLEFLEKQLRQFQGEATSTAEADAETDFTPDADADADVGRAPAPGAPGDTVPNGREVHRPTGTTAPRPVRVPVDEPNAEEAAEAEAARARRAAAVPAMRPRGAAKASQQPESDTAAPVRQTAAKKTAAKKTAAKKTAAKKTAAKKTATKQAVAKKTAAKKTTAAKQVPAKQAATKQAAAKKTAAKKSTPAKKTAPEAAPKREHPGD